MSRGNHPDDALQRGAAGPTPPPDVSEADGETTVRPLIFLSHSSGDRAKAIELRKLLEVDGYRVWMAPDDIRGSGPWAEQITRAIGSAAMLVVVISKASSASQHVGREVQLALDQGLPVLPVRVEDVAVSGTLQYLLSLLQWIDAFPPPLSRHRRLLVKRIGDLLEEMRDEEGSEASGEDRRFRRWMFIGGGAAAAVSMILLAVLLTDWRPVGPDEPTADPTGPTSGPTPSLVETPAPTLPAQVTSLSEVGSAVVAILNDLSVDEGTPYTYVPRTTTTGSARAELPSEWSDFDGAGLWEDNDGTALGDVLLAAPSISRFYNDGHVGLFAGIKPTEVGFDTRRELHVETSTAVIDGCTSAGPSVISGPMLSGHFDVYFKCEPLRVVLAVAADGYDLTLVAYPQSIADAAAIERFLESLEVTESRIRTAEDASAR